MKKIYAAFLLIALFAFSLTGCLNVEKKEYTVKLNPDNSGTMTVKYINIISTEEEDKDVSMKDFATLITDYYEGDKAVENFIGAKNVKKRLFEEDGVLCAELTFDFDTLGTSNIFQYDMNSPYMAALNEKFDGEAIDNTNGDHGLWRFKHHFLKKGAKELKWSTIVTSDLTGAHSLLKNYNSWKKDQD
jgi:hypothetical protein